MIASIVLAMDVVGLAKNLIGMQRGPGSKAVGQRLIGMAEAA